MNRQNPPGAEEILFEFWQVGSQMRIAAIDAKTGIEVIAIAPLNISEQQMKQLAIKKLHRRLEQLKK